MSRFSASFCRISLLLLTSALAPLFAQNPDVIVGDLHEVQSYGSEGAFHAYSVGTTSCNQGDADLIWISSTNEHPVIGQELFRLKDGRFEQIGISWLKHGFFALSQNLCATCSPTNGTALGVGCSDPYSAGLNGSQGNLGPRSEVNAFTGFFPYPPGDPAFSGPVDRRLRVQTADVNPALNSGAQYVVSGHYVTQDDAQAGNGENNASYRPVSFGSDASHTMSFIAGQGTRREDPGIQAWQDFQPTVTLVDARVPSEGLFILGFDVTNNGNGTWHYEYAIFNLNSDRCGQSFFIPVPAGVVLTNVGFHDVDYHSGESYSGADWAFTQSASAATWSTETHAVNPNANALRWSTLYNFRFDANVPPGPGDATLALFKPGTPTSLTIPMIQAPTGGSLDCNNNGIPDIDDVASGFSADCNLNGVPDECEEDCNLNGQPDSCDISGGLATDCDLDGTLDSCQLSAGTATDCDGDGVLDSCELSSGSDTDCNFNGIPDSCELSAGSDCDGNGILDECEASGIVTYDRVLSPPIAIVSNGGPAIDTLTVADSGVILDVDIAVQITHTWIGDLLVQVTSPNATTVNLHQNSGGSADNIITTYDDDGGVGTTTPAQPLSAFDGEDRFGDWSISANDSVNQDNGNLNGWSLIVEVQGAAIQDCNGNGLDDSCEISGGLVSDCDLNGIPDSCDITSGAGDCDGNGAIDSCELTAGTANDCDNNGQIDPCEIAAGTANDCDGNGAIDPCELLAGTAIDCDSNGLIDPCEIAAGTAPDCDLNGVLDFCDIIAGAPDCDLNGIPDNCDIAAGASDCNSNSQLDACEITAGTVADCNGNGSIDSCEIAAGTTADCDLNGIPDSCDLASGAPDCNLNGIPDSCDLNNSSLDCDGNGQVDSCEIASGTASDCNGNNQIDSCEIAAGSAGDCNSNGIIDSCDIAGGVADCDTNGVPDSCDIAAGTADCNSNGQIDSCEINAGSAVDCDSNGIIDS